MKKDLEYYQLRISFIKQAYLSGELKYEDIEKNAEIIEKLLREYKILKKIKDENSN